MAELNFPKDRTELDPPGSGPLQTGDTYTSNGTTWTYDGEAKVWGSGGGSDLTDFYLSKTQDDTTVGQLTADGGFVGDLTGVASKVAIGQSSANKPILCGSGNNITDTSKSVQVPSTSSFPRIDGSTGNLSSPGGFTGNLTGNADTATNATTAGSADVASQIDRKALSSSTNSGYRIMLAGASDAAGPTDAYVVSDATRLFYNPSTSTIGGVTTFAGRSNTCAVRVDTGSGLSGGGALTGDRSLTVDSTVIRTTTNQSMSGTKTFTGRVVYSGTNYLTNKGSANPPASGKATDSGVWLTSNTIYGIGNTNKGAVFGNNNVSDNWTTAVTFINGGSGSAGAIDCKKQQAPRFSANSDRRIKQNIVDAESMLDKFEALQVRRFTIDDPETDESAVNNVLGFIADELQGVFPDAVNGEPNAVMTLGNVISAEGEIIDQNVEDPATSGYQLEEGAIFAAGRSSVPKYQTVAPSALIIPMAKAIQELVALNKQLEQRIITLEGG